MKLTTTQLISILLVLIIVSACLFRYTLAPSNMGGQGGYGTMYKLDRWTGAVEVHHPTGVFVETTRRKEQ